MPHYRDRVRCNAKWFAAPDLGDRDVQLTISVVPEDNETMPDGASRMVIYFKEVCHGLVLNVTNSDRIAAMYGDDYTAWVGKPLTIYATETQLGRDVVPCIRIRRTDRPSISQAAPLSEVIKAATGDPKPVPDQGQTHGQCSDAEQSKSEDAIHEADPDAEPGDELDLRLYGYRDLYSQVASLADVDHLDAQVKADPLMAAKPYRQAILGKDGFSAKARLR